MLLDKLNETLIESGQEMLAGFLSALPQILFAILLLLLGWLAGAIFGRIIAQIISALKVDNALRGAGVEEVLNRAGFSLNAGAFLGDLVKWFVVLIALVAALDVLELQQVNVFLQEVVLLYLPQVIVAVLILFAAAIIGEVLQNVVAGSARAASMPSARFFGNVARWAIWIFAVLAALNHLGVAQSFVQTLFTGIVVAISLALGLAFGLGGQQAAAEYIQRMRSELAHADEEHNDNAQQ
jgi:ABC-type multidrug transport system fused ATPase/permease subunit